MEIRRLVASDAEAWWRIRSEALEREPFAFGKAQEEHLELPIETVAARFADAKNSNFTLGAFVDSALIGTATFFREVGLKERHKGRVFGVYVTAAQRGKGIGRALMLALLERAKIDPSLEQILLAVAAGQHSAKRLYLDCGFVTWGTEPHALKVGPTYVDEEHMILRL